MPDFEALVRRQQDQRNPALERLSLVQPTAQSQALGAPLGVLAFAGGLFGALLGTLGAHWAEAQGWLQF